MSGSIRRGLRGIKEMTENIRVFNWLTQMPPIKNIICPKCKSDNVVKVGIKIYSGGKKYQRYQCHAEKCGHVWSDKEKEVS